MWIYIIAAVAILILLNELIRILTVGKYGERYVFITGCDTGFGNMLAKRLDSLGFHVFAACFTEKGEDDLRKVSSARLKTLSLDVTKTESVVKARETVEEHLPKNKGLWAVVNNAGVFTPLAHHEMFTKADYEACLAVNLYGLIDVTKHFQPLVRKGQGRFVNISSIFGKFAFGTVPYCVSKYGVEAFSDCLRRETIKQGISVHILEPCGFKTDLISMGGIRKTLQRLFDSASPEVQMYYGGNYVDKVVALTTDIMSLSSPHTHLVVDAYTHAITAKFPRTRYVVGIEAKLIFRILWNLPEWLSDRFCAMVYVEPEMCKSLDPYTNIRIVH